jgi:hypothetical protein
LSGGSPAVIPALAPSCASWSWLDDDQDYGDFSVTRRPGPDRRLPEPWPCWLLVSFFRCGGSRESILALREVSAGVGSARFEDFASTCFPCVGLDVLFSSCLSWESRLTALVVLSVNELCPPLAGRKPRDPVSMAAWLAALALRRVGSLLSAATPGGVKASSASEKAIR